ncbi:MAG TPA: hypothetical protein VEG64_17720 [Candidatus Sulfotelmatobacter sp.]|nr:hypothetical protein [Candidatus Sulfotelmatobacter sp.]
MTIKNRGQTPAYKVLAWAGLRVIEVRDENTSLVVPDPMEEKFALTLAANGSFHKALRFERTLTPNEIADIGNGTRGIYLYGRIVYTDAFKKLRYTNFRLHYTNQPYPPVITNALFNFSEKGNDSN